MKKREMQLLIKNLSQVFDVVRLVDVSLMKEYRISDHGEFYEAPYHCYAVWNRFGRCENCISSKAYAKKSQLTKFEFIDQEVFFVISKYTVVDDTEYMLEMVTKITDETLFGAYGINDFVDTIKGYNEKLYIDTLTGAYNRNYYIEQLCNLPKINAVAMVDVDNFKQINDSYGHPMGDFILKKVVQLIQSNFRSSDAIVRFGGDEFVLTFNGITKAALEKRLEDIRRTVAEHREEQYPDFRVTLSIGAVFSNGGAMDLLEEADKALYISKKHKNKVEIIEI